MLLIWINRGSGMVFPRGNAAVFIAPLGGSRGVPGPGGTIVIHEYPEGRPFEILELPLPQRPPEDDPDDEDDDHRQGDQQEHDVHHFTLTASRIGRCNRRAFRTTSSELADMPIPAIHGVTQPVMANGMASRL